METMARADRTENVFTTGQRVFDRYYLKRTLGEGGMGVVWLAHDRVLEQPIALKFLAQHLLDDRQEIERLKTETRRNLKLAHPNIVRIHDFIQTAQGAAVAMEFVDGWSLWSLKVDKPRQIFPGGGDRPVDSRFMLGAGLCAQRSPASCIATSNPPTSS